MLLHRHAAVKTTGYHFIYLYFGQEPGRRGISQYRLLFSGGIEKVEFVTRRFSTVDSLQQGFAPGPGGCGKGCPQRRTGCIIQQAHTLEEFILIFRGEAVVHHFQDEKVSRYVRGAGGRCCGDECGGQCCQQFFLVAVDLEIFQHEVRFGMIAQAGGQYCRGYR